jgi:selenium metabolism protein YedF
MADGDKMPVNLLIEDCELNKIDARGLSCPAPVLETKALVESRRPQRIDVLVDNEPARQNVVRFLESQGYRTHVDREGRLYTVVGTGGDSMPEPKPVAPASGDAGKKIMVMVAADRMGAGDDLLGAKLMINFIKTLKEMGNELWRLVFVNSGVKLTIDGAGTLEDLKGLEEAGHLLLVCGTCLDHFGLLEKKRVGQTTNMLDIVTAMQLADKVINI